MLAALLLAQRQQSRLGLTLLLFHLFEALSPRCDRCLTRRVVGAPALRRLDALPLCTFCCLPLPNSMLCRFLLQRENRRTLGEQDPTILEVNVRIRKSPITLGEIAGMAGLPLGHKLLMQPLQLLALLLLELQLLLPVNFLLRALQKQIENLLAPLRLGGEGKGEKSYNDKASEVPHRVAPCNEERRV